MREHASDHADHTPRYILYVKGLD